MYDLLNVIIQLGREQLIMATVPWGVMATLPWSAVLVC